MAPTTKWNGNLTKSLTLTQYTVHQSGVCKITKEALLHARMLEEFLAWTKRDYKVNAWYRTADYNKKVGGLVSSNHLKGTATDIAFEGAFSYPGKLDKYADKWFEICDKYNVKGEFGLYANFYHIGSHITYQKSHCLFDRRSGKTIYL